MMNATLINNRYRILETLGRGGFGETYLVEDLHMPSGRKSVLKQLKPIVQQPFIPLWMKERFQREAAILEELGAASDRIPELYAYFSENEQFYLVQELIEGETLAQKWTREGNLTGEQVKQILVNILPVLDFIHSRKIVHRDIKPENIIIRNSDRLPVLIDFGAVKEAMVTSAERNRNSLFSAAIGTPGYMSSEQAAGRPVYSSDLYGLGLTAIFLLTGKAPQELEVDSQTGEIIWQQHAANVDSQLVEILSKVIRFHPRDRFSESKEMLLALEPNKELHPQPNISHRVTGKTVKVSPGITSPRNPNREFAGTVAYNEPQSNNKKEKKGGWLSKIFILLLLSGGLTVGALAFGFYSLSNWIQSRTQTTDPEETKPPTPIIIPPEDTQEESDRNTEKIIKIGDLIKKKKEQQEAKTKEPTPEQQPKTPEVPEVIVKPKPEIVIKPKPQPQTKVTLPILTTGTSENQLVSTLGQPTYERNEPQRNSKILAYRNGNYQNINLTYHSDPNGRIKQADVALSQDLSLGAMQETLTKLLGNNVSADAKDKLRNVYSRQTNLQSFRVGKLQGKIQRDSKDRVNISVWE